MKPTMKKLLLSAAVIALSAAALPTAAHAMGDMSDKDKMHSNQQMEERTQGMRQRVEQDRERYMREQARSDRYQSQAERMSAAEPAAGNRTTHIVNLERNDVRPIQQALRERGYYRGPIDGLWGPQTTAAMRQFEYDRGLTVTGRGNLAALNRLGFRVAGIDPSINQQISPASEQLAYEQTLRPEQIQPAAGTPTQIINLNRNDLRNVQQALRERGYYRASVDGVWGPRSAAAMREFERDHGLPVTGENNVNALRELGFNVSALGRMDRQGNRPMGMDSEVQYDTESRPRVYREQILRRESVDMDRRGLPDTPVYERSGETRNDNR